MTADILTLTIPLRPGMTYPSANQQGRDGRRGGRKTDAYRALAADVEEAGRAAVAAGWEPIAYPCRCWITRYAPDARVRDALNLGQCEANALSRAGVWTDDELARPIQLDVQPNSIGPDRIVIVIQRLAPSADARPRAPRPRKQRAAVNESPLAIVARKSQPAIRETGDERSIAATEKTSRATEQVALMNGKPIPYDEALRMIRAGTARPKPADEGGIRARVRR